MLHAVQRVSARHQLGRHSHEVLLQRAMAALRSDRTSFVIAHRLSTIRDADVIFVMENGAIVEQGAHAELLAARGHSYTLYNSQFLEAGDEAAKAPALTGRLPENSQSSVLQVQAVR